VKPRDASLLTRRLTTVVNALIEVEKEWALLTRKPPKELSELRGAHGELLKARHKFYEVREAVYTALKGE
jgi:hypothetical protein